MPYLTLEEAAQYVNKQNQDQIIISSNELLRCGVAGLLLICSPFGFGLMYNATTKQNENISPTLLVLPPTHLLEIEAEGKALIRVATTMDGKTIYFPQREKKREQLRIMISELDRFIPELKRRDKQKLQKISRLEIVSKLEKQKEEILNCLDRLEYDPLKLPFYEEGLPDKARSDVEKELVPSVLFISKNVLDTAWRALRKEKKVDYVTP